MKKSERAKASTREDGVDFISNMPDAVLVSILSRLPSTEEQLRSSILSRRWRHLWTAIPSLDMRSETSHNREKFTESEFKAFVDWVLTSKTVDLDSFRLECFNWYSTSIVWRWIHVAVERNVKQLILSWCPKEKTEAIELPHCLVTCGSLEVLKLDLAFRGLRLAMFDGFVALRVLKLTYVNLLEDDDLVKKFLESFPLLEELSLLNCVLYKLDLLCISCPNVKRLSITCYWENLYGCHGIKISCPKLVDMELIGKLAGNYFFEHLDSLKGAVIEPIFVGKSDPVLFHGSSQFKPLWEHLYFSCESTNAAGDLALPNLKTLALKSTMDAFTMDELIRSLKCCPNLENLKLTIIKKFPYELDPYEDDYKASMGLTPNVKRLKFFEFNGQKPKVVKTCYVDKMDMFCTWGNEASFLNR